MHGSTAGFNVKGGSHSRRASPQREPPTPHPPCQVLPGRCIAEPGSPAALALAYPLTHTLTFAADVAAGVLSLDVQLEHRVGARGAVVQGGLCRGAVLVGYGDEVLHLGGDERQQRDARVEG